MLEPTINDVEYSGHLSKELVLPLISAKMANRKSMEVGATRGVGDTKIFDFCFECHRCHNIGFWHGKWVVISKNGKIVTNYHVVGDSKVVDVYFPRQK